MAPLIPLSPEEGNGLFMDGNGDAVLLLQNAQLHKFQRNGNMVLPGTGDLAVPGDISAGDVAGTVASRTRRVPLPLGGWTPHASTPPTASVVGLLQGLAFDADAEALYNALRVPSDWDGASDLALKVAWCNQPSTAIANGETVEWNGNWRSKAEAEAADAGTAGAAATTYTEAADPGTDKEIHVTSLTIDYDDGDQPLAAGDLLSLELKRDMTTDTYASDAVLLDAWLEYTSTVLAGE
jgi:hypothetical protein